MDLYDKLTVDASIKPSFNGLEVKETKKPFTVSVHEVHTRRVIIPPTNPHAGIPDPCVKVPETSGLIPTGSKVLFFSIKSASTNPRGLQPLLVGKETFIPQHESSTKAVKLEADAITFFTTGDKSVDTAFGVGVPAGLWIFNPNKDSVAIDVKIGFAPQPTSPTPASPAPPRPATTT